MRKKPVQNITQLCDLLESVIRNTSFVIAIRRKGIDTGSSALGHPPAGVRHRALPWQGVVPGASLDPGPRSWLCAPPRPPDQRWRMLLLCDGRAGDKTTIFAKLPFNKKEALRRTAQAPAFSPRDFSQCGKHIFKRCFGERGTSDSPPHGKQPH